MTSRNALSMGLAALLVGLGCRAESAKTADTAVAGAAHPTPAPMTAPQAAAPAAPVAPAPSASGGMVDPNSVSKADLTAIPGVTEAISTAIVAGRPYGSMLGVDVILAKSLSKQQRDSVYTRLWMPIDLNKASGKEIVLIPGVGPRMRHEFEEYRPYASIEQFRREIGKYVDRDELARLERYVTLK